MHRSIGGLADAYQSIADAKASLNPKKRRPIQQVDIEHTLEDINQDIQSNERLSDTNKHYLDMESCTARIAARLRDMDSIDLNHHPQPDIGDSAISNQMKFIDDQCYRAQALLNGEFYMRNLHSEEVHKSMIELDERITYTAKNWKHSLAEMGIQDQELTELKAPAVEAAEDMRPVESDSKKVRRNSVMTQVRPTMVATEADYSSYNSAEINELNEIIKQFMDQAFISGSNGVQISKEVMDRCSRFKQKVLDLTHQMIEKKKRAIKVSLRVEQKTVRSQESEIALLHTQNEEALMVIKNQKENDTEIRKLVEAKFAEPIGKLKSHIQGIEDKIREQGEANVSIQKRFVEVQDMKEALSKQRLFADPFLRRRAENLVKGLLRNLNEKDLKEQEEREEQMQSSYQQWKKIIEFCTEKERQLGLMEAQEKSILEEIAAQRKRIEEERVAYRDTAKVLTAKDTEQSNKLLILEEQISERARDERRKVHYEHRESIRIDSDKSVKAKSSAAEFTDSDSVFSGRGAAPSSPKRSSASPTFIRDAGSDSNTDDSSSSSESERPHSSQSSKGKAKPSSRIKQQGLRAVPVLCDDYTEGVLGITYEHTKRQEISSEVRDHIPRPAPGHFTGSEASDSALLTKAHKILTAMHPAVAATVTTGPVQKAALRIAAVQDGVISDSALTLALPAQEVEVWSHGTNSAPRSPKGQVKFGLNSSRPRSSVDKNSNASGFWADGENDSNSGSDGDVVGGDRPRSRSKKQKTLEVYSLTSTACYVALYSRYLKKFPNLNFKRSNPRLEAPEVVTDDADYPEIDRRAHSEKKKPSELVKDNSRFQFSIREAVIVIKEALDSLLHCRCVDKIIVTDALEKLAELERRVKVSSLPEEEKEVRYQLHFLCVSLIHTTLSRAPRVMLVKNNRKYFVEISTTMLALLGVVLNCTLMFWQPDSLSQKSRFSRSAGEGGIATERVEFICAHLIELALTLGDVDHTAALSAGARQITAVTSSKTFRVKKTADIPPGPAGFIALLRTQTSELLGSAKAEDKSKPAISPTNGTHRTASTSPLAGHKGSGINYQDLLHVFNRIVDDEDASMSKSAPESGEFTMKHRHGLLSLQLFLYLALGSKEITMDEAILTLHKGIIDGNNLVRADASDVIPCDVDILLQQMHPGMVPAMLVLELLRRLLEEECSRVNFLHKIANSDKDVSDLQFLNVQFTSQFDVGLRHGRNEGLDGSVSANSSYLSHASTAASTVLPELTAIDPRAPAAPPSRHAKLLPHDPLSLVGAKSNNSVVSKQYPPLHVTRYKNSREVHIQWVEDLEKHLRRLGEQVNSLIRPAGAVHVREPSFVTSDPSAKDQEVSPPTAAIPLPDVLVYKILAHVNSLRTVTSARSVNGLARVQALQPDFLQIMRELLAARKRIIAIVTAMTWPLRKKITWLKMKYNTILEENGATNDQVDDYRALVERYQRDINAFKASIHLIEKEKNSLDYRSTKVLTLDHHDPQIQQLIIEHATDEYSTKYLDFKARETRLMTTIAQLSNEFDHLNAQHDTLQAAQRSLNLIDAAQDTMENDLNLSPPRRGSNFNSEDQDKPLTAEPLDNLNLEVTPKAPPSRPDVMSPVDQFIQRERLAESALKEPPKESFSAKQSADRAKELEQQRLQSLRAAETAQSRPRMPLFGASAVLQSRPEPPSLPPKLYGFAKRIESGLQAVGVMRSPTNASQKLNNGSSKFNFASTSASNKINTQSSALTEASADSAFSEDLNLGSYMSTAVENYADDAESNKTDIFGQQMPISQKQRSERGYLRKHSSSSKKRRSNSVKFAETASPFMWNKSGKMVYNHADTLAGPSADSPLLNDSSRKLSALSVDPQSHLEDSPSVPSSPTKRPDLTLRKSHIFIAGLDRTQPFRYDDIVAHDLKTNFTPLNIRKMIASLQEEQSEELATRRALSPYNDLLPIGAANSAPPLDHADGERERKGFRPGSGMEIDEEDDMYEFEDFDERDFDPEEDFTNADGNGDNPIDGGERRSHKHSRGGSSRDQNVGNGVTYAEYLIWKAKRKQQQQGTQQLEALKNSLNIHLRSARKVNVTDEADETEKEASVEEKSDLLEATADDIASQSSVSRDYSKTNSEVNFILSRSSSRAESIAANKRKVSSKRSSGYGSALHFGAAPVNSGEESALVEAERRARGENVPSPRASLVMRARASLINKLSRTLEAMENPNDVDVDEFQAPSGGSRSARQSVRRSMRQSMLKPLATIAETARGSQLVRHSSLYTPATTLPPSETKLEEARIVAHSIIHGRVLDSPKNKLRKSFEINDPSFDMQILDYIANDHLVIKGWEQVDLLKMNDNETFAGHSFKFDEQEDKLRISTLKEFASQVATSAEDSASRVENEYKAAIINLNRLVGKKITDTAEIDSALEHAKADESSAEKAALVSPTTSAALPEPTAKLTTSESNEIAGTAAGNHAHRPAAVYTQWPCSTDRLDSPEESARLSSPPLNTQQPLHNQQQFDFEHSPSPSPSSLNSPAGARISFAFETAGKLGFDHTTTKEGGPHPPIDPKPSVSFASPHRKSKISESKF